MPSPAESALEAAIGHLLLPGHASYRAAGEQLIAAREALERNPDSRSPEIARLVRRAGRLLHNGAALRLGVGSLAFPSTGQYTPAGTWGVSGAVDARGSQGRWEA